MFNSAFLGTCVAYNSKIAKPYQIANIIAVAVAATVALNLPTTKGKSGRVSVMPQVSMVKEVTKSFNRVAIAAEFADADADRPPFLSRFPVGATSACFASGDEKSDGMPLDTL